MIKFKKVLQKMRRFAQDPNIPNESPDNLYNEMLNWLRINYVEGMDLNSLRASIPDQSWLTTHRKLFGQAMLAYRNETQDAAPPAADANVSEQTQDSKTDSTESSFSSPMANAFYSFYLQDTNDPATNQRWEMLQGSESYSAGADIEKIDNIFKDMDGGAQGKKRNVIFDYYVNRPAILLSIDGIEIPDDVAKSKNNLSSINTINYLYNNYKDILHTDFYNRMQSKDADVFEFVLSRAKDSGGMRTMLHDQETGAMITDPSSSVDRNMGRSNINEEEAAESADQAIADDEAAAERRKRLGETFYGMYEQLHSKGTDLADRMKQSRPKESAIFGAYVQGISSALTSLQNKLDNEDISNADLKKIKRSGLVIKHDSGRARLRAVEGGDPLESTDWATLVGGAPFADSFVDYVNTEVDDPNLQRQLLLYNGQPVNAEVIQRARDAAHKSDNELTEQEREDRDYARKYSSNMFNKSQFLMRYMGPHLLEMVENNEISPSEAKALARIPKTHTDAQSLAAGLSSVDDDFTNKKRKTFVEKELFKRARNKEQWQERSSQIRQENPSITEKALTEQLRAEFLGPIKNTVNKMPEDRIRQISRWLAQRSVNNQSIPKDRKDTGKWLAKIYDLGVEGGFQDFDTFDRRAAVLFELYKNAINKIARLQSCKNKLNKFASTSHIDKYIEKIKLETIESANNIYEDDYGVNS